MNSDNKITQKWLYEQYPWLKIRTTLEDYVAPDYYDKLLKPYSFEGRDDTDFFSNFIEKLPPKQNVLELGTGTGRITTLALNSNFTGTFTGVDLSKDMINKVSEKFSTFKKATFIQSDSLKFLESSSETYDLVFSLWSLSHSIHQHMEILGVENGYAFAHRTIFNFLKNNLRKGGSFFLIHFDAQSEEQIILRKILRNINPLYYQENQQSYSKRAIDFTLGSLKDTGIIDYTATHHIGDPITYNSIEEALETFINFHLESYFNDRDELVDIYSELHNYFIKFKNKKKEIVMKPGCFIYEIRRL